MEKQLAQLYNKLENQVINMIPVEWEDVYFLGEVEKEGAAIQLSFLY